MTFDKYKEGREKFNDTVFPNDGYEYEYVYDKEIGWYVARIRKLPEFVEGNTWKNDFDIDKEIVKRKFKVIKKWIFNKIDRFIIWYIDYFPLNLTIFVILLFILDILI